jgi:hypothetical protein
LQPSEAGQSPTHASASSHFHHYWPTYRAMSCWYLSASLNYWPRCAPGLAWSNKPEPFEATLTNTNISLEKRSNLRASGARGRSIEYITSLSIIWYGDIIYLSGVGGEKFPRKTTPTRFRAFVHRLRGRAFDRTLSFALRTIPTSPHELNLTTSR